MITLSLGPTCLRISATLVGLFADTENEVAQDLHSAGGMRDLRMKLDSAQAAITRAERRIWRVVAVRDRVQRRRNRLDAIAVAHPHAMLDTVEALEQPILLVDHEHRGAVLARARADALRTQVLRDHIQAVTDPEHRASEVQHFVADIGRVLLVQAHRAARQNDAARLQGADFRRIEIERMQLAIDMHLAHAARDQLRVLAAEIKDQNHVKVP